MNSQERFKENRHKYRNKFLLGFLGGSGLLSVIFLAIYNFFGGNSSHNRKSMNDKHNRSPEQFEKIYNSSDRKIIK